MRDTRRLLAVLTVGLLVSAVGAGVLRESESATAADNPIARVRPVVTTTVPPTTTIAPASPPPRAQPAPAATRPVAVPKNPYAPEPLVRLGVIRIPKIGLNHEIFQGISLRTIDRGPSHWPGTALPGSIGNAVFAGHRVTHSRPFRNIDQLAVGDEVIFEINGRRSVYKVTGSEIVTPKALHIVNQTSTATATLFACHPPGSAKFRYVVHLALAEDAPPAPAEAQAGAPAA